jgi:hypothetical protein
VSGLLSTPTVAEATYNIFRSGPDHGIRGKGGKGKKREKEKICTKKRINSNLQTNINHLINLFK